MARLETDVAIIGGGPSGIAAALTLLRYTSHKVVLVERGSYQHARAGETVSSAITSLLDYLGAVDCLEQTAALRSFSNAAVWGSDQLLVRDHMFTGNGNGWHLDRRRFDLALADAAQHAGAITLRNSWLRSVAQHDSGPWQLLVDGEAQVDIVASQVIDASGRHASFARHVGAERRRLDQLVGVVAYFTGLDQLTKSHSTLVEAERLGWWYGCSLPEDRAVVAFMTDPDPIRELGLNQWTAFYRHLQQTRHISAFVRHARLIPELHIHSASSQQLHPAIGRGWVAAGDAVAAFDPLSSLGIGHAFSSGIQAARIVDMRLHGDEELAASYPMDIGRLVADFLTRRNSIYEAEQRWMESPFWRRRHTRTPLPGS